ncbi:MAG TPA: hypothetical protein VEB43_13610 [Anaeromyxobacter sp.]|nr:hypothetical protein [Anaeromyxobacter sp.]
MSQAIDAVLAGTKGFAVALLAPLTARIGNRPRVAGDPGQVLGLCSGPSALAVIEFMGEGSLPTIQALVRDGRGLRIVAGVPVAHAGAEGTLRALGVEVGRWDGKTDGVISAVERAVAAMAAPEAAPTRSAAPAAPPVRAPPTAAPRPAAPAPAPSAPRPAGAGGPPARPAAAAPALGTARPAAAATAVAAPRSAAAPAPQSAAPAGAAPAARPPAAPPQARPGPVAPAQAQPSPRSAAAPAPQPRPAPAAAKPSAAAAKPPAAPAPVAKAPAPPAPAAKAPAAPAAAQPRAAANFFDDLDADVSLDVADLTAPDAPAVNFHAPGVYVPPPPSSAPAADWPSGLSTPAQAEDALRRALQETADPGRPLHALALRTLESLSDLERAVLAGEPQPVDAAPIRRAAVMRLRVAEALASAPPQGSAVDSGALSAMMAEIDGLLAEVAPLLSAAPAELAPALESIRNALVREAIDFSEAAQRTASAVQAPPAAPRAGPAPRARVLSVGGAEADAAPGGRRWPVVALFVLVLVAAAAYHGRRFFSVKPASISTAPGAPASTLGVESGRGATVVVPTGKLDPAELEHFKQQQEAQGKQVLERNGTIVVVPAPPK